MREIKFRAWDNREENRYGEKIINRYIYDIQNTYDNENGHSFDDILNNPLFIIEQFTGLHDKNGKEIYEGDIIMGCAVFWNIAMSSWWIAQPGFIPLSDFDEEDIDVTGNIHENPELLKVAP